MKVQFKGIVKRIFPAQEIGEKKTKKVTVEVFRPGWVDQFGEKKGFDDIFELQVYNDKIKEDFLKSLSEKKVDVTAYLSTFEYQDNQSNETRHGLNLSLTEIIEHTS